MAEAKTDMTAQPPKLKRDLVFGRQKSGEKEYVVIKDPETGEFYRFNDAEHFVVRQLNGENTLDVVRRRAEEQFGAGLSDEALGAFVGKLEKIGLLERKKRKSRSAKDHGRFRGNAFYLRYKILDPNRLLNAMMPFARPFFHPAFVGLSAFMIVFAAGTAGANWGRFVEDVSALIQFSSIPLVLLVSFFAVSLHEFAHGLTCKHFGGDVHEMGFMLIYFQPALYCNVSDAWLFPEKYKRLWVGFAGPYFELFIWALATMMWRLTASGSLMNDFAVIIMATSGIKTLLNFNPLIKYDGYYLLSDYLEMPNLRKKSFRYLGGTIKRFFGLDAGTEQKEDGLTRREKRAYFLYGILGTIGTAVFMTYMVVIAGDFFFAGNEILGALVALVVGVRFRRRLKNLFGGGSSSVSEDDEDDASAEPGKGADVEQKGRRHRSNGRSGRTARRNFWIALALLAILYLFVGTLQLKIGGPFTILPVHNADVRTEVEGILAEILVTEGSSVRRGDVIARLSGSEQIAELEQTEADIRRTQARLAMQESGPTKEEIQLARTAVEKAEDRLRFAEMRVERNKALFDKGLLSKTELEDTQELGIAARNDLAEARGRLAVLLRGPRQEEIDATRAEIMRLNAKQEYLLGQITRLEVTSPVDGIVASPARQLKEMERQLVQKGALVAKVYDMKRLTVEIPVPENEIADITIGQEVAFKARAYPNETFYGTVTSIGLTARGSGSSSGSSDGTQSSLIPGLPSAPEKSRTILVTTEIDNSALLLKPGMTGEAKIYCGERRIVELIMRRLNRTIGVELWSWW